MIMNQFQLFCWETLIFHILTGTFIAVLLQIQKKNCDILLINEPTNNQSDQMTMDGSFEGE